MNKRMPILLGILLVVLSLWLQVTTVGVFQHFIDRLENLAYDMQLRTTLVKHYQLQDSTVVIVDVDDKSVAKEGRWPWQRTKLALLNSRLQEAGSVVIVWDMFFAVKEANIVSQVLNALNKQNLVNLQIQSAFQKIEPLFDNDAQFAQSLSKSDTVIGMSFLPRDALTGTLPPELFTLQSTLQKSLDFITENGYIGNIDVLQKAVKGTGFVNVFSDDDGIIRKVPLLIRYQDKVFPSLALEAVRLYLLSKVELVVANYGNRNQIEGVRLANHVIPTDEEAQVIIPFRGRSFTFPYFSATDVLNKKIPPDVLQGKIVFIGTSATGLGDLKPTAIESTFPGVEIQASIADGILTDNFSFKPAWAQGAEIVLTIILGLLSAWFFPYLGPRVLSLIILIVPSVIFFLNNALWSRTGLLISIFIPIFLLLIIAIVNIVYGYLFETRRREHIKEMFGQYVPAKHIDEMLTANTKSYALYGEDREMTVLFADIRNFTTISEGLTASQLKEMLSDFFTPMTEVIFNHRGTIDKYVGDLIMAFWGAPLKDKRHAQHAISAALDMQKTVKKISSLLAEHGWPDLKIGIGLNSGVMSVGDMGSKFRRNYTVLGDAVNLASRIEGLTKYYQVEIMVGEVSKENQRLFLFRQLDRVRVKGKKNSISISEVIGRRQYLAPEVLAEIEISSLALNHYFDQNWDQALQLFKELQQAHPEVFLYSLYIDRINQFKLTPPPSNWDGVFEAISK